MSNAVILVVDESLLMLALATFSLESAGYAVRVATDMEAALVSITKRTPRVILVDTQSSETNGLELIGHLKAHPTMRGIIVLAIVDTAADRERVAALGGDGCVPKPIHFRSLPIIVADHIRRAESRSLVD